STGWKPNEISERDIAPCFVNGLKAYDGEVNLEFDENLISNEFTVKLCLDYEFGEELPLFICKMGRRNRNKKRTIENLNLFYQDIRPSSSARGHLTQKEAEKEALAVKNSQKFALLEEERPVIETMAYNHKYQKILDEILRDKVELDGKTVKEEEDVVKRIKGEALKEKDDPGAFIFPIRLEGKVNENALADIRFDVLSIVESDSDDEEEYVIKRNRFGTPIYGPKPAPYLNSTNLEYRSSAIQTTLGTHDEEAGSSQSKCPRQNETMEEVLLPQVHYEFLLWEGCSRDAKSRLREAGSDEEIFISVAWIRAFNINEPINVELCHEFYSTYEFDKVCAGDDLQSKKIIRHQNRYANVAWVIEKWMKRKGAGTQKETQIFCGQFISKLARNCRVLTEDVVRSLSALIYCRDLDTTTLRDLIDFDGIPNDIYSLIDSNKTAKDLWDAFARHMLGSEYGEQDMKAAVLYEYETFKATEGELLLDTYIRYLQNKNLMDINIDALYNILKQNQGDVNDAMGLKKKTVVVTSDPLALIAKKTDVSISKEKVVVSSDSEGSKTDDFNELKKITALLAKASNRRKFYSKSTNNNLRTSSSYHSANKKQEFVKTDTKKVEKKDDEKKRDMSRTKMLLAKKDKDEQVLLAEDQTWMKSSSDSDQEINANMVFMAQIKKVLSDFEASSSSADEKISEVSYYLSDSESESEFKTSEYYDNSTNYGLFVNNDDEQEIFHDAIDSASENFIENHIDSQKDYDKS
nr:hypothetical protein [Tanacetum cinerariifolium]